MKRRWGEGTTVRAIGMGNPAERALSSPLNWPSDDCLPPRTLLSDRWRRESHRTAEWRSPGRPVSRIWVWTCGWSFWVIWRRRTAPPTQSAVPEPWTKNMPRLRRAKCRRGINWRSRLWLKRPSCPRRPVVGRHRLWWMTEIFPPEDLHFIFLSMV